MNMNAIEIESKFREFPGSNMRRLGVSPFFACFDGLFVNTLFDQSRRRRINEGADGLLEETARVFVADQWPGFAATLTTDDVSPEWLELYRDQLWTMFTKLEPSQHVHIRWNLDNIREAWLPASEYTRHLGGAIATDHPMKTLTEQLNFIDASKGPLSADMRRTKAEFIAALRVGNLAFPRTEWKPRIVLDTGEEYEC